MYDFGNEQVLGTHVPLCSLRVTVLDIIDERMGQVYENTMLTIYVGLLICFCSPLGSDYLNRQSATFFMVQEIATLIRVRRRQISQTRETCKREKLVFLPYRKVRHNVVRCKVGRRANFFTINYYQCTIIMVREEKSVHKVQMSVGK